ncbi:hypothetical protein CU097_002879, partial [Rhizopus azygosporus]
MTRDVYMEDLSLEDSSISEEQTSMIYTREDNDCEQFVKENDEKVKLEKFAENPTSNTSKTNSKKSAMPYKTYTTSQIVDFIGLIVDQAQIKDTAAKTGITLSTAYRYQKMWNETQEVPGEKKRGR